MQAAERTTGRSEAPKKRGGRVRQTHNRCCVSSTFGEPRSPAERRHSNADQASGKGSREASGSPTLSIVAGVTKPNRNGEHPCGDRTTIGRSRANDISLCDPKASRSHALVRRLGDGNFYLIDMGSSNGTFVNEHRVTVPRALAPKDRIRIGDHVLEFHSDETLLDIDLGGSDPNETHSTMLAFGAVVHRITVLVSDIRGYTSLSEQMSVSRLADMLGRWFAIAGAIVEENGGVVDKFIGDAVMVRWLAENSAPGRTVAAALRTAHELGQAAARFNTDLLDLPLPFRIGVGINTGQAVVGTLGSIQRHDYTAVGDAVNLAFRFESLTKDLNTDVVLGPDSYRLIPDDAWRNRLHSVSIKDRELPVAVCRLSFSELSRISSDLLL